MEEDSASNLTRIIVRLHVHISPHGVFEVYTIHLPSSTVLIANMHRIG
jgi:hypothetical protein